MTTISIDQVQQWTWENHSPDHRAAVPVVPPEEHRAFSALMDLERPSQQQIALREAIRRKISYRISREIGW